MWVEFAGRGKDVFVFFFFQAEDGIRDYKVTGVQTCALPIFARSADGGANEEQLTPTEYKFPQVGNPGTGSSGVGGIQTVVLKGNPNQAGEIGRASCRERV